MWLFPWRNIRSKLDGLANALHWKSSSLAPGMVFFMHMILMDSENELAMNLGETYLLTDNGNERLGKKKLDLVVG